MTVDAIHASLAGCIDLLLCQPPAAVMVFSDTSISISYPHPRNLLTLVVRRNVVDRVGDIHVPVNSCDLARGRTAAADAQQHARLSQRVLFVVSVVIEDFQLRAEELFGPVTLLAGFRG